MLGRHAPQPQFPLLFKFLDAQKNLSVQVHPNDQQAAQLTPPDRGKTEAWIVMHTAPGSRIYAGLKPGIDRESLRKSVQEGWADECLHWFEPAVGDCIFIPAGTVHAIGTGLVIAEIQQSSDTTFRLFDWNRVGGDGKPRPLHVPESLEIIDFEIGPRSPIPAQPTSLGHVQQLVACDKFVVDRWQFSTAKSLGGDNRCHILVPLGGAVRIERDACEDALKRGQTILIPAAAGTVRLEPMGRKHVGYLSS